MKKLKYILIPTLLLLVMSCGDDFLTRKNLVDKLDEDYYSSPKEVQEALTATYACLPLDAGNNNPILVSELMSDDRFSGGGTNDVGFLNTDQFLNTTEDYYLPLWKETYAGIFRANMIIKRFKKEAYDNAANRDQALGEAYFLRAYFYFRIAQHFGSGPLIIDPAPVNLPKAKPEELYGQIAADLKMAIELMPATNVNTIPEAQSGHATKWAAEGLMARVFLFYTGYYSKSDLPVAKGSAITKDQVIGWIDDCVANSGHALVPDFRNIWPYSYSNTDYPYGTKNNLSWVGDYGNIITEPITNKVYLKNKETVFAIKFSPYGDWNAPGKLSYSNQLTLYMGLRGGNNNFVPFGQGWGGGPVNPQLLDVFEANDIRKKGSILDVTDPDEGEISTKYKWNDDNSQHETGLYGKKYTPIQVKVGAANKGMYFSIYNNPDNMQLWNMQDMILLRFADILLMGAELGGSNAQSYLDQVRTRAGLASVPVSLDAIKKERRCELAFEGLRYFDILRWHEAKAAIESANGVLVKTLGDDVNYTVTYREETGGWLPIPESQVRLSSGVLLQNPGW